MARRSIDPVRNNSRAHNMRAWADDENDRAFADVRKRAVEHGVLVAFHTLKSGDLFIIEGSDEVLQAHPGFQNSPGTYGAFLGNKYRDIGDLNTIILHIPRTKP